MTVDKIDPLDDSRISHHTVDLNGKSYHYLLGNPKDEPRNTVFLIHGWPDLSMGWRYQIPMFLEMGLRVVCPDMMGYGRTDAPDVPPESLSYYGLKRAADDVKELAKQLGLSRIILGGHDWGGAIVYRVALWHPELISHLFSICTPYLPPTKHFVSLEDVVKTKFPQFGYQIHLASGQVEKAIVSKGQIRQFLKARYGGHGPKGEALFSPQKGVIFENLPKIGPSPLMTEREMDYYADEYTKHSLHSTLNWYRTRKLNYEEELTLEKSIIDVPVLFVQALQDAVLTPDLARGMEQYFPKLTRREVATGHWALWEAPEEVNGIIRDWLDIVAFEPAKSSL